MRATRVAVLLGGISPERDISLDTGKAVLEHLPRPEFDPLPVELLADGSWRVDDHDPTGVGVALVMLEELGVDVVFPGLHGVGGEDGAVQGLLEVTGLPYVGSGVAASAIAMDKPRARDVVERLGLALPRALEIRGGGAEAAAARVLDDLGLPAVVKDPLSGSSIDVAVTRTTGELASALAELLSRPARRALVERFVPGREFTCAVLGNASLNGDLLGLPPLLVRPTLSAWCNFKTKYARGGLEKIADLPGEEEILERVREDAVKAHRALRCDGLTRSDFIVPEEDGIPRFLEVNTLPGLTATSLCPAAARVAGISFPELLARLVRMALDRAAVLEEEAS